MLSKFVAAVLLLVPALGFASDAHNVGPKECNECHEAEYGVWKETPHFESYKKIHKSKDAKKILKALDLKSMKKAQECALCHYTMISKKAGKKPKAKAGPSCESCHNPASVWMDIHNDFGGPDLKAEDETPEHKIKRLADAEAANMIASRMVYDIASSCMRCHGLANPDLEASTLAKMLDAGHPINDDFEIVSYSQGSLRHRFTPPDVTTNNKLDPAGTARLFIGGQAAALVSAHRVMNKTDNADFKAAQKKRLDTATRNLKAVAAALPEVKALLASPNDENARKVVAAMKGKDLSSAVAGMIANESDFK